jgi:hypothetical protein
MILKSPHVSGLFHLPHLCTLDQVGLEDRIEVASNISLNKINFILIAPHA